MNDFLITGSCVNDVEIKTSQNGTVYGYLIVSCPRSFKNQDGNVDCDFYRVTLFKNLAEAAGKSLVRGTLVMIRGHLQDNNYSRDEELRYNTSLIADKIAIINSTL